jgi:hypothetical protein
MSHRPDTSQELFDEKSPNKFHAKFDEEFDNHPRTMALNGQFEKTGKASERPTFSCRDSFCFSRLGGPMMISYADTPHKYHLSVKFGVK